MIPGVPPAVEVATCARDQILGLKGSLWSDAAEPFVDMEPLMSESPESLLLEQGEPRRLRSLPRLMSGTNVACGFRGGGVKDRPVSNLSKHSLSSGGLVKGPLTVFKSFNGLLKLGSLFTEMRHEKLYQNIANKESPSGFLHSCTIISDKQKYYDYGASFCEGQIYFTH